MIPFHCPGLVIFLPVSRKSFRKLLWQKHQLVALLVWSEIMKKPLSSTFMWRVSNFPIPSIPPSDMFLEVKASLLDATFCFFFVTKSDVNTCNDPGSITQRTSLSSFWLSKLCFFCVPDMGTQVVGWSGRFRWPHHSDCATVRTKGKKSESKELDPAYYQVIALGCVICENAKVHFLASTIPRQRQKETDKMGTFPRVLMTKLSSEVSAPQYTCTGGGLQGRQDLGFFVVMWFKKRSTLRQKQRTFFDKSKQITWPIAVCHFSA